MSAECEPLMDSLAAEAEQARERILAAVDREPERWWEAPDLREAAGVSGPIAMYVICRMANPEYEDTLELDGQLRLRRRRPPLNQEAAS